MNKRILELRISVYIKQINFIPYTFDFWIINIPIAGPCNKRVDRSWPIYKDKNYEPTLFDFDNCFDRTSFDNRLWLRTVAYGYKCKFFPRYRSRRRNT